jgi:hypothetical protein
MKDKFLVEGVGPHPSGRRHFLTKKIEAVNWCVRGGVTKVELEKYEPGINEGSRD